MSVYVRLNGGLGNQMFEYAFLYSLLYDKKCKENIYCVMHHASDEDARKFSLDCFNLSLPLCAVDEHDEKLCFKACMAKRKILHYIYRLCLRDEKQIFERLQNHGIYYTTDAYLLGKLKRRRIEYVEGFFQAWVYFEKFAPELRKEFTVKTPPDKLNEEKLEEINSCEAVCVHIRRGDFLNNSHINTHNICNYEYYCQAIDEIKENVKNPVFFVFSNTHEDIEWIKENWDLGDVRYVDLQNQDYEELRLMYSCKHFIISNSTYSWWAKYLSSSVGKVVIAPSQWYRGASENSKNIFMDDWHLIEV